TKVATAAAVALAVLLMLRRSAMHGVLNRPVDSAPVVAAITGDQFGVVVPLGSSQVQSTEAVALVIANWMPITKSGCIQSANHTTVPEVLALEITAGIGMANHPLLRQCTPDGDAQALCSVPQTHHSFIGNTGNTGHTLPLSVTGVTGVTGGQ